MKKFIPLVIIVFTIAVVLFVTWTVERDDTNGETYYLEWEVQTLQAEVSRLDRIVYELEQQVYELEMEVDNIVLLASQKMQVYHIDKFELLEPGRIDATLGVDIMIGDIVETAGGNYLVTPDETDARGFSGLYIGPVEIPQI